MTRERQTDRKKKKRIRTELMTRKIIFNGLTISFQNTVHYRMFQFQATLFTYFVIKGYFNAKTSIE